MNITEFLTARYDEAEAVARGRRVQRFDSKEPGGPFAGLTLTFMGDQVFHSDIDVTETYHAWVDSLPMAEESVAVLADLAAKRAIVALLTQSERTLQEDVIDEATLLAARQGLLVAQMACRSLTQPYAEHPDFDPAWRA